MGSKIMTVTIKKAGKPKGKSKTYPGDLPVHLALLVHDKRTALGQRWHSYVNDALDTIHGAPSIGQISLAQRFATLSLLCEMDDARVAKGEKIDSALYVRRCLALNHLGKSLGLLSYSNAPKAKTIDQHATAVLEADAE